MQLYFYTLVSMSSSTGLAWQGFLWGGLHGWLLWEETSGCLWNRHSQFQPAPKWTHCWTKLSSAGMLVVPPWNHIQERVKKHCMISTVRKEWGNVSEIALQIPKSDKKEGEEVFQTPEHSSPCSPWRKPWRAACPSAPLQPMHGVSQWSRYPHCSSWRTPCQSRWICPGRSCSLWTAHAGVSAVTEAWALESPQRNMFPGVICTLWETTLELSIPEGLE